jgi:hypothetical protein
MSHDHGRFPRGPHETSRGSSPRRARDRRAKWGEGEAAPPDNPRNGAGTPESGVLAELTGGREG